MVTSLMRSQKTKYVFNGHRPQRNGDDKKHCPSYSEKKPAVAEAFDGLVLYTDRSLAVSSPSYNTVDSDVQQ